MHSIVWFWTTGIHDPAWVQAFAAIALVLLTIVTLLVLAFYAWDTHTLARTSVHQAGHMSEQTEILRQSVAIAKTAADAAEMSAKAAMGVAVPTLMLDEFQLIAPGTHPLVRSLRSPWMQISVKNYGQSPAFLKSFAVQFTCEELPEHLSYPWLLHYDPIVTLEPGHTHILEEKGVFPWSEFTDEDASAIASGKKTLTIYGCVWYDDVFGSPIRELKFCKWGVEFATGVSWIDCGLGERYRISTEEQRQPHKPN